MQLRGCGTALITPFRSDGTVDDAALSRHVEWQIDNGIKLLIPAGTTGEAATLSEEEWLHVVELTVQAAAGRVPVFAGSTHNSTREAVSKVEKVSRISGLGGILTANPYYNRPGQQGQFEHFRAISEATNLPILLYNIPARTGANLLPQTALRLAELPNIVGIKESSGNLPQITELLTQAPDDFHVFAGDDSVALPTIAVGGAGLISVASNAIPQQMASLVDSALDGDWKLAREVNRKYFRYMQANFMEPNPAPIKAAMAMLGRCENVLRLPMVPVSDASRQTLAGLLKELDILHR